MTKVKKQEDMKRNTDSMVNSYEQNSLPSTPKQPLPVTNAIKEDVFDHLENNIQFQEN